MFLSLHCFGQPKKKVLVIDSILVDNANCKIAVRTAIDPYISSDIYKLDSLSTIYDVQGDYKSTRYSITEYLNGQNQLHITLLLPDTSAIIDLPLDDSGGVLSLHKSYYLLTDTIRVNKLKVLHNCLPDTVKTTHSLLKNMNDTVSYTLKTLKYKVYPKIAISKNCISELPNSISVSVNNNSYTTSISIVPWLKSIGWYHGYPGGKQQRRRNEKRRMDGKPYTYWYLRRWVLGYHLSADIVLVEKK